MGDPDGATDGALVGNVDGASVIAMVGVLDGSKVVGKSVEGGSDGGAVIVTTGAPVTTTFDPGAVVPVTAVGTGTVTATGKLVGATNACGDRCIVFFSVGYAVGYTVGNSVGEIVGNFVGDGVTGAGVGGIVGFSIF